MLIKIVSFDVSMSNLGIAKAVFDTETDKLTITECITVSPVVMAAKSVRQNSKDLNRAKQLILAIKQHTANAHILCGEMPVGSQSSRACVSYGMSVTLMAVASIINKTFIEVMPLEVKNIVGNKEATKKDVIAWVQARHPEAPLTMLRGVINFSKAEHQADAIVAIHAAMRTPVFNSIKTVLGM